LNRRAPGLDSGDSAAMAEPPRRFPTPCAFARPLMGPEHPAGDEIAEHSGGDERNRNQENGNTVATFHPPQHSSRRGLSVKVETDE
jgi:hypothetical protein